MGDVLIRDVPDGVLSAIDARAARVGLSRSEFLRRRLAQEALVGTQPLGIEEFEEFTRKFADLADDDVMSGAWD